VNSSMGTANSLSLSSGRQFVLETNAHNQEALKELSGVTDVAFFDLDETVREKE
jgi:hypothetical protein